MKFGHHFLPLFIPFYVQAQAVRSIQYSSLFMLCMCLLTHFLDALGHVLVILMSCSVNFCYINNCSLFFKNLVNFILMSDISVTYARTDVRSEVVTVLFSRPATRLPSLDLCGGSSLVRKNNFPSYV
jgi:hypothetical protein